MDADYQLIIVGGGPDGLSAGLYAARARLKALLIEKGATGGQVLTTDWVDNYPGFSDGISGFELIDKMTAHVDRFGLEKQFAEVVRLDLQGRTKTVFLENGEQLRAQTVILATGARPATWAYPGKMNSPVAASPIAPPVTVPFTGTRRSRWSAGEIPPFRRRFISPSLPPG
jgi:thioredoxin reductase (NADPH)